MGWEPITYCRECGDAFDVYMAPEDRICECCKEWQQIMDEETARVNYIALFGYSDAMS